MTIQIPEYFRPTLDRIGSMPDEQIAAVRKVLETLTPHVKPEAVLAQAAGLAGPETPDIAEILKVLSSLGIARLNAERSLDDFVRDIARSFPSRKDKPFDVAPFEARLKSLLGVEALVRSARAFDIQHEYEHVFRSARILTDVRPMFDESGAQTLGLMVVHNLKISYMHSSGPKEMVFALDDADIAELKKILNRAEIKTQTLEKLIDKTGVPYFESKERS